MIGYLVRRNGVVVDFTTGHAPSSDFGLTPSTAYSYDIRAVDTSGNVSPPGVANTTTTANTVLVHSGDVWSYQSGGTPDPSWKQPGLRRVRLGRAGRRSSAGATATRPPWSRAGTLTQYYVRHFNVDDTSAVPAAHTAPEARRRCRRLRQRRRGRPRQPARPGPLTSTTFVEHHGDGGGRDHVERVHRSRATSSSTGDNVIAAEVHQDTNNNVGLELRPRARPQDARPRPPRRRARRCQLGDVAGSTVALSWSRVDRRLRHPRLRRPAQRRRSSGSRPATTFTDTGLSPTSPVHVPGDRDRHLREQLDAGRRWPSRRRATRTWSTSATAGTTASTA